MREIKFRAWDKSECKMLDWLLLSQTAFNRGESGSLLYDILVGRKSDFERMQYTGLKDKNGKEIYEGDIIKQGDNPNCRFSPRVVEFKDGSWIGNGIRIYLDQDRYDYEGIRSQYKWEIIGNVHENPELIKS